MTLVHLQRGTRRSAGCRVECCGTGLLVVLAIFGSPLSALGDIRDQERVGFAVTKAETYLRREEARWRHENRCYSCHNQGLAVRAVCLAWSDAAQDRALDSSLASWLVQPAGWDVQSESAGGDQGMADLHFALAALAASQRGLIRMDPQVAQEVARRVASHLEPRHLWPADPTSRLASPLSLGPVLGTHLACGVLIQCDPDRWKATVSECRRRVLAQTPQNVPDAGAILWMVSQDWQQHQPNLQAAWTLLRQSQTASGGWGPYPGSPPEVFDTAMAVIGLCEAWKAECPDRLNIGEAIAKGVSFLLAAQEESGGWSATSRPSGRDSYAQHIATTAWALEALVKFQCLPRRFGPGQTKP